MIRLFHTGEVPLMDVIELQGRVTLPADVKAALRDGPTPSGSASSSAPVGDAPTVPLGTIVQDHLNAKRCTLRIGTLHVDGSRGTYRNPLLVMRRCSAERVRELAAARAAEAALMSVLDGNGKQAEDDCAAPDEKRPRLEPEASHEPSMEGEEPTLLLSDWLERHPECLSIDALYFPAAPLTGSEPRVEAADADASSSTTDACDSGTRDRRRSRAESGAAAVGALGSSLPYLEGVDVKDYELVGLIEDHVCFHSKPARVFI